MPAVAYVVSGLCVLAGELAWRGMSDWNFSDGVYLETSRLVLGGHALYSAVAAAQPPGLFLCGAAILAVSSSIWWVHGVLSVVALCTGGLVAAAVWRLTARTGVAALAGVATLVTPWMLREHLSLTPETLAGPLLLGAALGATRGAGGPVPGYWPPSP